MAFNINAFTRYYYFSIYPNLNGLFIRIVAYTHCQWQTSGSIIGDTILCVGETSQAMSPGPGTWTSSNPSTATINNDGLINASGPGLVGFTFYILCYWMPIIANKTILVNPNPAISIDGPSSICLTGTTQLSPNAGGVWTSNHPTVASVNNSGLVTGLSQGVAQFRFTESATGCASVNALSVVVYGKPTAPHHRTQKYMHGFKYHFATLHWGIWISSIMQ